MAALLAPLDVLILAGLALTLILGGVVVLRPLLVSVLGSAPLIGGWLAANVDAGLGAYERWLAAVAGPWVSPAASALDWLAWIGGQFAGGLSNLADEAYAALWRLKNLDLPALEARAAGFAAASVAELRRLLLGSIAAAASAAEAGIGAARTEAVGLFQSAEAAAVALAGAERAAAEGLFEVARTEAADLAAGVRAEALAGVAEAEALANELAGAERAAMLAAVGLVEHDLQALAAAERVALADSLAAVGGDVTAAAAQSRRDLAAVEAATQRSIDGILDSLPWQALAARVGASEEVLKADVRTLVMAGAAEIRRSLADAESIRARYGPQVRAALADLKGA